MTRIYSTCLLVFIALASIFPIAVNAQLFTYQGELSENGATANGQFDMRFELWDGPDNSAHRLAFTDFPDIDVVNGRFTVDLFFPNGFSATGLRWLVIEIDGTELFPRTLISHSPYSIRAERSEATRGLSVGGTDEQIGLGTANPTAKLDVVSNTTDNGNNTVRFSAPNIGPNTSHVHFGLLGDWFIRSADEGGKVVIQDTGGTVGIGTATASDLARLTVNGGTFENALIALSLDDTQPTINAINIGSGAALWAQGTSDSEPDGGGLIVAGAETGANISIDRNEIMARNNGQTSTLFLNADGGNISMGQQQTHPAFAYVRVNANGTILSSSLNVVSVVRTSTGTYLIDLDVAALDSDVVIASGEGICLAEIDSAGGGRIRVKTLNSGISPFNADFSLVVYRP